MARKPHRIGLVLSYSQGYCRGILRGVKAYAESLQDWIFTPVEPDAADIERLRALRPAGIIAQVYNDEMAEALASFRRPLVNVSGVMNDLPFPRVGCDDPQTGRLAADHLLDRGFRQFGFAGQPTHAYSNRREEGFREVIKAAGYAVSCHHEREPTPFDPRGRLWALDAAVRRWMASLPKPVGVFVPNDLWGLQLAEVCRQERLRVPEDVAIVGVDNDDLLCELARPALSSVIVPADRIGFEAAGLLDRYLQGGRTRTPPPPLLLPPPGVLIRRSSDVLSIEDAVVAAAIHYIREHAHRPIQVADILEAVSVSRRSLERRFRARLARSVWDEIRQAHMRKAKASLSDTELPMSVVAANSGFSESKHLSTVFRQETGMTPTAYRRRFRRHTRTT
jgi:LacI family transcriptional regulator